MYDRSQPAAQKARIEAERIAEMRLVITFPAASFLASHEGGQRGRFSRAEPSLNRSPKTEQATSKLSRQRGPRAGFTREGARRSHHWQTAKSY